MDILQRISRLNPEKQKLLEQIIQKKGLDIFKIPVNGDYRKNYRPLPLSFEQEPIWFVEQLDPNNTTYDVIGAIRLEGNLNKDALKKSINEIVKRHEILRTLFIPENGKPTQVILPSLTIQLECIDFKGLSAEEKNHRLENLRDDRTLRFFDLSKGHLLATLLLELEEDKYIFVLIMNHLISDLISLRIFFKELAWFYEAFLHGTSPGFDLPGLSCQYVDYACWQRRWFQESQLGAGFKKKQEEFWIDRFKDGAPVLSLPTDYPRPAQKSHEARQVFFTIKGEDTKNLKEIVSNENTTLYVVLLSILYVFLAKVSGQDDVVVGTPISSRKHKEVNDIIGLFTRTLALRNYPQGEKIFKDFLKEVNTLTLKAYENQEYQYEELVSKILAERDASRNPLFEVMFNFIYLDAGEIEMSGLKPEPFRCRSRRAPFDIELTVEETKKELFFKLSYSSKMFKPETIERFISYYKKIIETVGKNPGLRISQIEIIPGDEKRKILVDFNNTQKALDRAKTYIRLFEDQVEKVRHRIAAVYGEGYITYGELNEEAAGIAALLSRQGAAVNTFVSLYLRRSIKMLAAILGIFKLGAAYLPLEIEFPETRIRFILENSENEIAVTEKDYLEILHRVRAPLSPADKILCLDHGNKIETVNEKNTFRKSRTGSQPESLSYLIYTSGTTGQPKGVLIHQLGMLNHLYAKINDLSITGEDTIAQTASACFDISVWQFLAALLKGGTTLIIDKEILLDSLDFLGVLQERRITILEFVPSLMIAFLEAAAKERDKSFKSLKYLKWMVSTGEPLTPQLVNQWYRNYPYIKLVNAYGPTEVSDDITHYIVPNIDIVPGEAAETQTTVPIGKPLQNLQIYILDKYLCLCPIGVRGEICVAGIGVGKGYWKNSEKTGAAFIPNPYAAETGNGDYTLLYKTGDMGYFRPDGNIECLGRLDSQVKIRGNRIELGEIESQLLIHDKIKEAVVIVRTPSKTSKPGENVNKYLCAYIAANDEIPAAELRAFLSEKLPDYMVPSYFIPLEKIPLTPNGKVNHSALPEPVYEDYGTPSQYIPPSNEIEAKLVDIWSEILEIETNAISIDANFFELGGHSLKTPVVISEIHRELHVKLPLTQVFKYPNIKELSAYIQEMAQNPSAAIH